jgi:Kef-type K+ transport system membrane component KefB
MPVNEMTAAMFLIFFGAAVLSTLALWTKQSMMASYILVGVLLGPFGFGLLDDQQVIKQSGDIGIIFLLFLLGLHLDPKNLLATLKQTSAVGLISSLMFLVAGFAVSYAFGFGFKESWLIGSAVMFSSTIIGLKLLPTTILHHQHIGELMISILLLQDLLAIVVLLWFGGAGMDGFAVADVLRIVLGFPLLVGAAFLVERYVLLKLIQRYDSVREYVFLMAIAWCLTLAEIANHLGLTDEVGAFIAGVTIATSSISLYIAECLKPVRDFFLVLFFFSVGAAFDLHMAAKVIYPACILALLILVGKPFIFRWLLQRSGETKKVGWEIGVRLGQSSEFSLLVAYMGLSLNLLCEQGSYLIQSATLITFFVSSYWVVKSYPTPMAVTERLRQD